MRTLLMLILVASLISVSVLPAHAQDGQVEAAFLYTVRSSEGESSINRIVLADTRGNTRIVATLGQELSETEPSYDWSDDRAMFYVFDGTQVTFFDGQGTPMDEFTPSSTPLEIAWVGGSNREIVYSTYEPDGAGDVESVINGYSIATHEVFRVVDNDGDSTHTSDPLVSPDGASILFEHEEWRYNCYLILAPYDRSQLPLPTVDMYNGQFDPVYRLITARSLAGGCYGISAQWLDATTIQLISGNAVSRVDINVMSQSLPFYLRACQEPVYVNPDWLACQGPVTLDLYGLADVRPARILPPQTMLDLPATDGEYRLYGSAVFSPDAQYYLRIAAHASGEVTDYHAIYLARTDRSERRILPLPAELANDHSVVTDIRW